MFNLLTDRGGLPRPVSRDSPLPSLCPVAMSNTAAEERESRRLLLLLLLLAELRRARETFRRPRGGEGPTEHRCGGPGLLRRLSNEAGEGAREAPSEARNARGGANLLTRGVVFGIVKINDDN